MPSTHGDGWPTVPKGLATGGIFKRHWMAPPLASQGNSCALLLQGTTTVISLFTLARVPSSVSLLCLVRRLPSRPLSNDFPHIGIYKHSTSLPIGDGISLFHGSWQASDAQPASPTTPQFQGAQVHLSSLVRVEGFISSH